MISCSWPESCTRFIRDNLRESAALFEVGFLRDLSAISATSAVKSSWFYARLRTAALGAARFRGFAIRSFGSSFFADFQSRSRS